MDVQKTLDYLESVCTEAMREWRKGNTMVVNQLPSPIQFAFNNIYAVHTMAPEFFPTLYPQLFEQCDKIRVSAEHDVIMREQVALVPAMQDTINGMAAQIARLEAALAKFMPAQPADEPTPQAPEGDNPPAVTDGEGEPETDAGQEPPAEPKKPKVK